MYSENEQGYVTLTLARGDYERLMLALGYASGAASRLEGPGLTLSQLLGLVNRINEGNPNYRPYTVPGAK